MVTHAAAELSLTAFADGGDSLKSDILPCFCCLRCRDQDIYKWNSVWPVFMHNTAVFSSKSAMHLIVRNFRLVIS